MSRDLISRALDAQIPNPGSVSRRKKRERFDVSPRAGAVGVRVASVTCHNGLRRGPRRCTEDAPKSARARTSAVSAAPRCNRETAHSPDIAGGAGRNDIVAFV